MGKKLESEGGNEKWKRKKDKKKLRTFFLLLFTFRKPLKLPQGLPIWNFDPEKLKSCWENIGKNDSAPPPQKKNPCYATAGVICINQKHNWECH